MGTERRATMPAVTDEEFMKTEVEVRLSVWRVLFIASAVLWFGLGALSVLCSSLPAAQIGGADRAKLLSAIAAASTALLGFTRPESYFRHFIRAFRDLGIARARYKHSADRAALMEAVEAAERQVTELDFSGSQKPVPAPCRILREVLNGICRDAHSEAVRRGGFLITRAWSAWPGRDRKCCSSPQGRPGPSDQRSLHLRR